ncbi:unnamed protein product [Schistocephalus solidus]|uniref:Uncharacterized protein n=1 Tax=Schistocephalus solidus TaxID=70667 RepID=A0A183SVB3_SCHSO|nr:unnamed protein product [Schistocephalus solidus]
MAVTVARPYRLVSAPKASNGMPTLDCSFILRCASFYQSPSVQLEKIYLGSVSPMPMKLLLVPARYGCVWNCSVTQQYPTAYANSRGCQNGATNNKPAPRVMGAVVASSVTALDDEHAT